MYALNLYYKKSRVGLLAAFALGFLFFFNTALHAQNLEWVKMAKGEGMEDCGQGVVVDGSGNCYVTGNFSGTTIFGYGEPNQTIIYGSGIFVAKYNSNGKFEWVTSGVGFLYEFDSNIAIDANNNIIVVGDYHTGILFGSTSLSGELWDIFIAKYNSNGVLIWAKSAGGPFNQHAYDGAVDVEGNIYLTGFFYGTAIFGLEEANTDTLTSFGSPNTNIFVAKYSADGALIWAKQAGDTQGSEPAFSNGVSIDKVGNCFVTGMFHLPATFGAGEPNQTTLTEGDLEQLDIFIAKYDPNGMLLWAKQAGGSSTEWSNSVTVDNSGNSIVTGSYGSVSATFGSGEPNETTLKNRYESSEDWAPADIFIAKYDPNGALVWAKSAGGVWSDGAEEITTDSENNIYITGDFEQSATFGDGEVSKVTLTSAGYVDIFIAQYDPNGVLVWVKQAGGTYNDTGKGLAVSGEGVYVTGGFIGSAIFGVGEPNQKELHGTGSDIFVAKFEGGSSIGVEENNSALIPTELILAQNYPNPFNPSTMIKYGLPKAVQVELKIFDLLGRELKVLVSEQQPAGTYQVQFDSQTLPAGLYFYRLRAGEFCETKKMIIVK